MITQDDFYAIAHARPEMLRAFQSAVKATIEFRREARKNKTGFWSRMRLKKKAFSALFLSNRLLSGFVSHGKPLSEQEQAQIRGWIVGGAEFMEEQEKAFSK